MKKLLAMTLVLMLALAVMAPAAYAADYPTKGILAINPWGAGGGTDNCLRAFCAALEKQLGQTITVDNQTGAGGVIGHEAIADAEPDGYTIGMITWELASYGPLEMSEYTYENYIPLCRVNTDAAAISVNTKWAADNGITDLKTFIDYCKAHPGEVTMGGSSSGSVWHVAGGYLDDRLLRRRCRRCQGRCPERDPGRDRLRRRGPLLRGIRRPDHARHHGHRPQRCLPRRSHLRGAGL